jgi:serine/threonine-protein kinase
MKEPMLTAGTLISHYRITSHLGAGGMGEVYLAQDTRLGRRVALKFLPPEFSRDEKRLRRFKQEACAASALNHPNIITIHEIGESDSAHYIATEFIDGVTLRARIKQGPMRADEALGVAAQVADALAAAHAVGVVHRDIKPENVMLRADGYVKVLDFGLAKWTEMRATPSLPESHVPTQPLVQTDAGLVMGTVYYMSPEQARGLEVDARTDVFSLGVVIYEMLSGQTPFTGPTKSDVIAAILEREPPPLARFAPGVPAELQRIVTKALVKDREERYQTVRDMALDLRRLKQELEFEVKLGSAQPSPATGAAGLRPTPTDAETLIDSPAAETASPRTPVTSRIERFTDALKRRKAASAAALALLLCGGLVYFMLTSGAGRLFAGRDKAIDSIAIMPLVNTGNDPNMEYLSDGITESLINSLSQLPNLKVMSRNSVFRYKGRETDALEVARQLGVRAVLTGRVMQQGDGLAISVELVDALDNSQIWGEQYKRKLSDIFAVQEEIAREISANLRLRLTGEEQKLLTRRGTDSTEAYQLYLKGEYFRNKWTPEGTAKAIEYYNQAIAQDPAYALAYVGLAHSYGIRAANSYTPPKEAFPKAKAAAMKALEIDQNLADPHYSLGMIALFYDRDWTTAGREFARAVELKPNTGWIYGLYSNHLSLMGRNSEAIAAARRGVELDPLSLIGYWDLALVYYEARQFDQAIEACRKAIEIDQNFPLSHLGLGMAYKQKGMTEEAIAEFQHPSLQGRPDALGYLGHTLAVSGKRSEAMKILDDLKEQSKQRYVAPLDIAVLYVGLGEKDQAFEQLEKAYEERTVRLYRIKTDPVFDSLRSDPRFTDLLRRMGLTP